VKTPKGLYARWAAHNNCVCVCVRERVREREREREKERFVFGDCLLMRI
jgi:hypothetical protein